MRIKLVVLRCPCGFRSSEVPIGLEERAERTVFFAAYYEDGQLISVDYPLPLCVDVPKCIEENIRRVLEQTHGSPILNGDEEVDATCPRCGRDLQKEIGRVKNGRNGLSGKCTHPETASCK